MRVGEGRKKRERERNKMREGGKEREGEKTSKRARKRERESCHNSRFTCHRLLCSGDASPTYLVENTQWDVFEGNEGCSEPRVIPASFIRHIFPDARIIIMLRDPIER